MAKKSAGTKPPPKCKAILICEQVIVEAVTGRVSVINTFNSFFVRNLPSATSRFSVFLQLTDSDTECQVTIEIHDLREDEVIARSTVMTVPFPQRLLTVNVVIPCPPLPISHSGAYDLVVFADGQEIDRQKFHVHSRDERNEGDEDDDDPRK
jgi:hypothetical protein